MKKKIIKKHNWKTPEKFYESLNKQFNFNFDPCPHDHDMSWDGLEVDWKERNFVNPPYDKKTKEAFVKKAIEESRKGKLCVMLLPVCTSDSLFHDHILPNQRKIFFMKDKMELDGKKVDFDSMLVFFQNKIEEPLEPRPPVKPKDAEPMVNASDPKKK